MTKLFSKTTHAKHDPAHCLTPNLFRTLKRGDRKKLKLDVKYDYGANESIRFTGFEPLDAFDMRILQALTALAGPSDLSLDINRKESDQSSLAIDLIKSLNPQHAAKKETTRVVKTTICGLLRQLGYTDGKKQIVAVEASLYRLANVSFELRIGDRLWVQHILGYGYDQNSRDLYITLNHRITDAVLNRAGGKHTIINMCEVRAIKGEPAAILHQRLCAVVDPGKKRNFKIETLISYIWADEAEGSALRKRRVTLGKAIEEIKKTGSWLFTKVNADLYLVERKKYRTNGDAKPY